MGKKEKTGGKYVEDSFLLDALSQGKAVGADSSEDFANKNSLEQLGKIGRSKKVTPGSDEQSARQSRRESIVTREPDGGQVPYGQATAAQSKEWVDRGVGRPAIREDEAGPADGESDGVRQAPPENVVTHVQPDDRECQLESVPDAQENDKSRQGSDVHSKWQPFHHVDNQVSRQSLLAEEVTESGELSSTTAAALSLDETGEQSRAEIKQEPARSSLGRLPHRSASGIGWLAYTVFMPIGFFVGVAVFFFPVFIDRVSLALQSPANGESIRSVSKSAPVTTMGSQARVTEENQSELSLTLEMEDGLRMIRERTHLTALADRAIVDADRPAFSELIGRLKEEDAGGQESLRQAAQAEILRVKLFYSGSNRLGPYRIPVREIFDDPVIQEEADLSTFQLIGLLDDRSPERWAVRARAARLLGSRNNPIINRALLKAMDRENHLEVLRELVYSFQENTGYRGDFFDVGSLRQWWQAREQAD